MRKYKQINTNDIWEIRKNTQVKNQCQLGDKDEKSIKRIKTNVIWVIRRNTQVKNQCQLRDKHEKV